MHKSSLTVQRKKPCKAKLGKWCVKTNDASGQGEMAQQLKMLALKPRKLRVPNTQNCPLSACPNTDNTEIPPKIKMNEWMNGLVP